MERLHIAFFGPTNSGKSTLVNAICGQEVSLVSEVPGTTTDPVRKTVELPELGPCVLIDTAGLDDTGILGSERERRSRAIIDETDIAVILDTPDAPAPSEAVSGLMSMLEAAGVPSLVHRRGDSVPSLLQRLAAAAPREEERFLTGGLVHEGNSVLLVMPQDSEAPKGRLILPQVQVLRELLDRGCVPHSCTPDSLKDALQSLSRLPDLVITDSQVFGLVERSIPKECPLTSFSVLLAAAKGDIRLFVEGAGAINTLKPGDRVLIAEACTHVPDTEDIGRVKIPALLRRKAGDINVEIAAGNDFPEDLSPYALIIHCGACVANARLVRSRLRKARLAGVPITNYGIAIAALQGILPRISLP
ncbi:MAG: 50S ribosome-binding GTPase [Bacteroidales bacterium]|nr:50S ribosome-binding GTPase [Bacteroidales bacterium]